VFFDNLRHMEICKANNSKIEKLSGNSGKGFFAPVCLENFILHSPLIWFSAVSSLTNVNTEYHQPVASFIPFLAEGFGLNFDLIETNILNLAVVLGVVLYLGGDVLTSLLNDRKQKILGTLKSANERFVEAEQKLAEAKQKVQIAQGKAIEIRQQGQLTATQTTLNLFEQTKEEIQRLEESKQATLRFEEEKAMSQVRQQVVNLSIERAFSLLRTKIDASVQRNLIDANMNLLAKL